MKSTLLLLLIVSFLSLNSEAQTSNTIVPPPEPLYDLQIGMADSLLDLREYKKVVELLSDFPPSDTAYATSLYKISMAYMGLNKFQEALEHSQKGMTYRTMYKRHFYEIIGAAYDELGDYQSSMNTLNEGLLEFPTYTRFIYQKGVTSRRAKKYEDAMYYYQEAIKANPFHSGAHLNLGIIMQNSNHLVHALLSYYMFLLLDSDADKSLSVLREIENIGNGQVKIHDDSLWIKTPVSNNSFQELESLIKSKWPLNPNYKSRINLNYTTVIKTLQILGDKMEHHATDTSFFMQFYVPFILDLVKSKNYDASIYLVFRSLNNDPVKKAIAKQQKNIDKMKTQASDYLNKFRKAYWKSTGLAKYDPWFNNNGVITSDGEYNEKLKLYTGDYRQYWISGRLRSEGKYTTAGKSTGTWKFYNPEGELRTIKIFKDDLMQDSVTLYYPDGLIEQVAHYQNNKGHGVESTYYNTKGLKTKVDVANGIVHGEVRYFHRNGQKELETTLVNNKVDSKLITYYNNGQTEKEQEYKNGVLDGASKTWHRNGKLQTEGRFIQGKRDGQWNYYFESGNLEVTGTYKNDLEQGNWKTYNEQGQVLIDRNFVAGKIEGEEKYYDDDGKLWSVLTYAKGITTKYRYIDKNEKLLSSGEIKGNRLELNSHYANGMKFREKIYINDKAEGVAVKWNIFGQKSEIENYKNDNLDGKQLYYYDSGKLRIESNYRDNKRHGLYTKYYSNGTVEIQGWYENGVRRGIWNEYRPDGTISESYFFQNGKYQGDYIVYNVSGKPETIYQFNDDILTSCTGYDHLGNIVYSEKIPNGEAKFNALHSNKKVSMELSYKNGSIDGVSKAFYCNGNPKWVRNYKNGIRNGSTMEYDWEGNVTENSFYSDDSRDSTYVRYSNGKMYLKTNYLRGELHGPRIWYYPSGNIEVEGNYVNGDQEGHFSYFDNSGELRYRLLFKSGNVISYSYKTADGNFVAEIPLPQSTGEVKTYFGNGNLSATFIYNCGYLNGSFKQYHSNGKIARENTYTDHEKEGFQRKYNTSGQLESDESYLYDYLHGVCKYYNNGIIQRELNYVMGVLHGPIVYYDKAGKIQKKIEMNHGEPCN